jgi:long-chain acyl-CoA synthetase
MAYGVTAHAQSSPAKAALVLDDGSSESYAQLDARSSALAHAMAEWGVEPGSTVAAMLPNGLEFVETAIAAAKLGARFLPVNYHLTPTEVDWIVRDSEARLLVVDADVAEGLHIESARVLTTGAPYAAAAAHPAPTPMDSGPSWQPVFYTSGTTGRPKGVMHGFGGPEQAAAGMQAQVALWRWQADDVHLVCGPAYHAGPGGWTMTALYAGATSVIMRRWDAREWLRLVDEQKVTRAFMVPAHFIRLLEVPEAERARYDLSSLRLIVHGAAPCPIDVKRRILDWLPCEVSELYGGSEGGATHIRADEWRAKPGSVGRPWPGVEVRILDPDGGPMPPGEQGLIYIKPPHGRFHYHRDEEKTRAAWRDDAFTVGDVGYLDDDGYLFITDRASDMVIRGGVNIYPREVEEVLHTHPAVVDCAVFGVPDDRNGEELKAVVEAEGVDAEQLQQHCRDRLAGFKVPRYVELVDALPRDPNGKVLKRRLRDMHWRERERAI